MKRIPTPKNIEAEVLFKANHTCSICYDSTQRVQIAHIDGNNQNYGESNLIILCLNHHNEVDSKPSQSKGYTIAELKKIKDNWETIVKKQRESLKDPSFTRLIRFDGIDINTVYIETESGVLRGFQDYLTFKLLGFNWGNIDIYPDKYRGRFKIKNSFKKLSESRKIRLKFLNGELANEVYIIWEDGKKHHVPDPETLDELGGWYNIEEVGYEEFNAIPHGQTLLDIFSVREKDLFREEMMKQKNNHDAPIYKIRPKQL